MKLKDRFSWIKHLDFILIDLFCLMLAFIIAYFLIRKRCKKENVDVTLVSDLCCYLIIVAILGARIYYCLFNLDYYLMDPFSILKIWEGGLAIHGGIISGLIFCSEISEKVMSDGTMSYPACSKELLTDVSM